MGIWYSGNYFGLQNH